MKFHCPHCDVTGDADDVIESMYLKGKDVYCSVCAQSYAYLLDMNPCLPTDEYDHASMGMMPMVMVKE